MSWVKVVNPLLNKSKVFLWNNSSSGEKVKVLKAESGVWETQIWKRDSIDPKIFNSKTVAGAISKARKYMRVGEN